ncbi:MAG TPA: glycosyltransferase family 2 protein [Anaerolineales bacterium]|nr:glycosyltransferase family 2 protein [Anaerolineales bacterium]
MPGKNKKPPVKLSVIVPAYNEGFHIYENLLKICSSLQKTRFEIIIVDDGSTDATFDECKRAARVNHNIKPIRLKENVGKGASLFQGFEKARGEIIAFLDADLEIAPHHIVKLLTNMRKEKADVVAGVKDPGTNRFPLPRQFVSWLYRQSVSFLFGLEITDTQTGIKLFKREVLEDAIPRMSVSRFAFDLELLVAASRFGYKIVEAPVEVTYVRKGGMGRMKFGNLFATFLDTLGIYFRASFWRWLEPSAGTQFWMVVFVLGVFLAGIGFAKILSPIILQPTLDKVSYIVFLRFIPAAIRDPMLAVSGVIIVILSLIQLNKSLLKAFARKDRGDLAGILRK